MSEVKSTFELKRGAKAPEFSLPDTSGKRTWTPASLVEKKKALLVIFACNHCPYVKHLAADLGALADEYADRDVQFVAINANDAKSYPDDAPEKMKEFAKKNNWTFPYLFDESQSTAKAFGAACTPDFFLFNSKLELTYVGQYDGSRPGNCIPMTGSDLRAALEATLRNSKTDFGRMRPSSGCNIKWKPGNEPAYFE